MKTVKQEIIRARVDPRLAKKVKLIAHDLKCNPSEALRLIVDRIDPASLGNKKEGDAPADQAVCVTFA